VQNLLVDLTNATFAAEELPRLVGEAHKRGYTLRHIPRPNERILSWIDLVFGPSSWSSETRKSQCFLAEQGDEIVGFAAFDARGLPFRWLKRWTNESDVGIFGPFGVKRDHRKTGIGELLLLAALAGLRQIGYARALVPAVGGDRLIAYYKRIAAAETVDEFEIDEPKKYRTTILASGDGTNAQAVIDRVHDGSLPIEIVSVIANKKDAQALVRAQRAKISQVHPLVWDRVRQTRDAYDEKLLETVSIGNPELVLFLGWMHLVNKTFLDRFPDVLNVHPAFLPYDTSSDTVAYPDGSVLPVYRGAKAIRDQAAAGVRWSGVTVHRVNDKPDRGAPLTRVPYAVPNNTKEETLANALHPLEHRAVASAIRVWTLEHPV